MNLKVAWEKFRKGDPILDDELEALIQNAEDGIEFLINRQETGGVLFKTRMDLETLRGYQRARRDRDASRRSFLGPRTSKPEFKGSPDRD